MTRPLGGWADIAAASSSVTASGGLDGQGGAAYGTNATGGGGGQGGGVINIGAGGGGGYAGQGLSPEAHAIAWASGPGIHPPAEVMEGAARLIEAVERKRRFWRALALFALGGDVAGIIVAVMLW